MCFQGHMTTSLKQITSSKQYWIFIAFLLVLIARESSAQPIIPSDGSDGPLNIVSNTVIDLSQAVTGVWSNDNSANTGKGIYDPSKWAVIFKYSSVSISNGAKLSFKNHPTHAPVVWLVTGNVTIAGELSLDGQNSTADSTIPEPGPGGYRGGAERLVNSGLAPGPGFGPGGDSQRSANYAYGNSLIVPLIGGSGSGPHSADNVSGGAGGGAVLIASAGTVSITGSCHAYGGSSANYGASGGGIRILADHILGNGSIYATGTAGGGSGRIRLEGSSISPQLNVNPSASAAIPVPDPPVIWPSSDMPTLRLVSVAGKLAPNDPHASILTDVDLVITTNLTVLSFETANFPTNGRVDVFVKPRNGTQANYQASIVSGNNSLATWQLLTNLPLNYCVIQARAVAP
jgi:hypothetical protein